MRLYQGTLILAITWGGKSKVLNTFMPRQGISLDQLSLAFQVAQKIIFRSSWNCSLRAAICMQNWELASTSA